MKKKLEAELISIAHRILKLKNKSDILSLHQETQKLYEKLSVLRFVEESFGDVKPTIGSGEIEDKLDSFFDKEDDGKIQSSDSPKADNEEQSPKEKPEVEEVPIEPEMPAVNPEEKHEDEVPDEPETDEKAESSDDDTEEVSEIEATEVAETEAEDDAETDTEEGDETAEDQDAAETDEDEATETETEEIAAENDAEEIGDEILEEVQDDYEDNEDEVSAAKDEAHSDTSTTVMPPDVAPELEVAKASAEDHDARKADFLDKDKEPHTKKDDLFIPSFELAFDPKSDDSAEAASPQFSFDDLLGKDYVDPVFVKPDQAQSEKKFSDYIYKDAETIKSEAKSVSLNDRLSKGITIGLNDRIAFIKHLFANSSEDYNRVLSQLMTFSTYDEARNFIDEMVKPDYNDWTGKEEYANRFMDIIEKRFS